MQTLDDTTEKNITNQEPSEVSSPKNEAVVSTRPPKTARRIV
jgi:hypothetical protein